MKKTIIILFILVIFSTSYYGYSNYLNYKNLKKNSSLEGLDNNIQTKSEISINENKLGQNTEKEQKLKNFGLKTDTSKIIIDFEDILSGGPGKDGIPAINNPKFLEIKDATNKMSFLNDKSTGISVEIDGKSRFYPYEILVWHEIVNDTLSNKKIAITFCPLCGSAIVYERILDGKKINFGVSGLLYQSNLMMYDDLTESLWSQSLGKAVVGDYLGKELVYVKSNVMTYQEYKKNYPNGEVLSSDTGFDRSYGYVPYGDYDSSDILYFPVKNSDLRFPKKELFYIINDGEESIAFLLKDLRENKSGEIKVGNKLYKALYNDGIIDVKSGDLIFKGYYEMWFSWVNHNVGSKNVWFLGE